MCGLIGIFNTGESPEPANETALLQFENQMKRGMEGFGIIKIMNDLSVKIDRATEPYKFIWDIHQDPTNRIIVHHRQPTSTDNLLSQTHPIIISNGSLKYDYLVIHNGIINNDDELKEAHEKLGFAYATLIKDDYYLDKFNDSESFAIELARYIEGQTDKLDIKGSAAFFCLQMNKTIGKAEKLFFGRHGNSPLRITKTRNKLLLASEHIGNDIKENILYSCMLDNEMKLAKKSLHIPKEESECSFSLKGSGSRMYQSYEYEDDGYGLTKKDAGDLLQEEFCDDIQLILEEFMTHAEWEKGMIEEDIKGYAKMIEERMAIFNKKMSEKGLKESSLGLKYSGGTFEEGKRISIPKLK